MIDNLKIRLLLADVSHIPHELRYAAHALEIIVRRFLIRMEVLETSERLLDETQPRHRVLMGFLESLHRIHINRSPLRMPLFYAELTNLSKIETLQRRRAEGHNVRIAQCAELRTDVVDNTGK